MIQKLLAKIVQSKNSNQEDPRDITTVAVALLIEVIKADHQYKESEFDALRSHCQHAFELTTEEAEKLIEQARIISNESTSLWEHTDLINQHMDDNSKYQLILDMWKIAYSDKQLDRYEEHLIRRVCELTYVPHTSFIKAKHEALKLVEKVL